MLSEHNEKMMNPAGCWLAMAAVTGRRGRQSAGVLIKA